MGSIVQASPEHVKGVLVVLQPTCGCVTRPDMSRPMIGTHNARIGSRQELAAYLDGDELDCLECGRRFRQLGRHLRAVHGMTPAEYRRAHDMPAGTPLAGRSTREARSRRLRDMIAAGVLTHDHLPHATELAKHVARGARATWELRERAEQLGAMPRTTAPPGTRDKRGNDMERKREYARARKAAAKGNAEPMRAYRAKWA